MYVYLVVFDGVELKNKCFNTWNCIVCPFSVGIEAFLWLNQGGGGMLDLKFFEKKNFFQKNFAPKFILSDVDCISTDFLKFWSILGWGRGELRLSHFSEFFLNLLNLIMHIGGPLSFRLVYVLVPGNFIIFHTRCEKDANIERL